MTKHYHLDAVIAVGYRINSYNPTQFRIWDTGVLNDYVVKVFVIDDVLLKKGKYFGKDDKGMERIFNTDHLSDKVIINAKKMLKEFVILIKFDHNL